MSDIIRGTALAAALFAVWLGLVGVATFLFVNIVYTLPIGWALFFVAGCIKFARDRRRAHLAQQESTHESS